MGGLGFFGGFWGCHPPWGRGCPPETAAGADTSMRLTMLRHDSVLKPLVRRSLSAKSRERVNERESN